MNLKSLAKDTALYGLSSIVGRFLNYLLVIPHTHIIPVESGGYGIVTNLYAYKTRKRRWRSPRRCSWRC